MTTSVTRRAMQPGGGLSRRTALEALQNMKWDNWQSPVVLPMRSVLRFTTDGPDEYYIRPHVKMQFFERVYEVNPYSGWAREYHR